MLCLKSLALLVLRVAHNLRRQLRKHYNSTLPLEKRHSAFFLNLLTWDGLSRKLKFVKG